MPELHVPLQLPPAPALVTQVSFLVEVSKSVLLVPQALVFQDYQAPKQRFHGDFRAQFPAHRHMYGIHRLAVA